MNRTLPPLLIALTLMTACGANAAGVTIDDAWIPEAPPGSGVMAGYLTLRNATGKPLRCDAVSGADFGAAEIHRSVIDNGQSRMLRDQVIDLAPGTQAVLERGGLHLMLFRPQRALRAGDQTELQIRCGEVTVTASFRIDRRP